MNSQVIYVRLVRLENGELWLFKEGNDKRLHRHHKITTLIDYNEEAVS